MSEQQSSPQRSIKPRDGWSNIFTAKACGEAQFNQGLLYEASYQDRPVLRFIYNPRDYAVTGRAVVTIRCILCDIQPRAMESFEDYPMIGTVDVKTIRPTLKMSTERILNHLATEHDETLGGVNDVDFFNSVMGCCDL